MGTCVYRSQAKGYAPLKLLLNHRLNCGPDFLVNSWWLITSNTTAVLLLQSDASPDMSHCSRTKSCAFQQGSASLQYATHAPAVSGIEICLI